MVSHSIYIIILFFSAPITWNNEEMTLRTGDPSDAFTINGATWKDGQVFYTNLPSNLQARFPMYGTHDVNTGQANSLVLQRPMVSFMLRQTGWSSVPLDGWTLISSGNYLGTKYTGIDLYEKTFPSGTYTIDNNSAMYLFDEPWNGECV